MRRSSILWASSIAVLVVAAAGAIGTMGASGFLVVALTAISLSSLYCALKGRPHVTAIIALFAGLSQGVLAAGTQDSNALLLDDLCLPAMLLAVYLRLHRRRHLKRLLPGAIAAATVLLAVGTAHAPDAAIYQARQIAVPVVLLYLGSVLTKSEMTKVAKAVFVAGGISIAYIFLEELGVRIIDPWSAYGFNEFSTSENAVAAGRDLPGNYYYYLGGGAENYYIRAGGLHFNPPGLSIFMASIAFYALAFGSRTTRWFFVCVAALGPVLTVGRAGGVIVLSALFQIRASRIVTRTGFVLMAVGGALFLNEYFGAQGNSTSHSEGLAYGTTYALTHPLGGGFGLIGNASDASEENVGESLLGMFFASTGWLGLLLVAWLTYRALRAGFTLPGVALTAAIVTSALSESTSGLAVALPLWIFAGYAFSNPAIENRQNANGAHRRTNKLTPSSSRR